MLVEKRKTSSAEIPTGSLADMAFLLLIFFLVVTTIGSDKGIDLVLPPEGDVKPIPMKNIMNILLNDNGDILIDEEPRLLNQVKDIVKDRVAKNDKLIVSVKTTRVTPYRVFIAVLDQLKQADARKISIAEPDK
ncbi:biopolymer transporter ExbD [bacterium]|nr:biopolymer transporter ExbD [bacterium]